jgi:hypothetical protein
MTYPSSGSQNQWGFFSTSTDGPNYAPPIGTATPPPTGQTDPPDAPDATSEAANNFTASWPYVNGEMPATFYTSNLVSAAHDGVAFGSGDEPSPALNVAETTPNPPSGSSYEQQGAVAIANTLAISGSFAGVNPASLAVFNFGAVGNV